MSTPSPYAPVVIPFDARDQIERALLGRTTIGGAAAVMNLLMQWPCTASPSSEDTPAPPVAETKFVQFTEVNDNEGETWHLWLQVDGNADELAKLRALLDEASETAAFDLDYTLTGNVEPESNVDLLVKYGDEPGRYSPAHQKVVGRFVCPDTLGEDGHALYKGALSANFAAVTG